MASDVPVVSSTLILVCQEIGNECTVRSTTDSCVPKHQLDRV